MLPIFLATYGAVFVAEIVGDKLLYTTGVLAARYRTVPIMLGMALAFMLYLAPDRRGAAGAEDPRAFDCGVDWTGDSGQSRRDFGEQVVYLGEIVETANSRFPRYAVASLRLRSE